MRIGKLNRRVEILELITSRDEYGGEVGEWKAVKTVWASIVTVSGTEQLVSQQVTAEAVAKITMRFLPWLTVLHRIRYGKKLYEIVGAVDADTAHTETIINCKEKVNDGLQCKTAKSQDYGGGCGCACKRPESNGGSGGGCADGGGEGGR